MEPTIPADIDAELPRSGDGLSLLSWDSLSPENPEGLALAFDPTLDDPITRRASCRDRFGACQQTNDGKVGDCVDLIEVCPTNAGGKGCCPRACLDEYKALRAQGLSEWEAEKGSIGKGACLEGFLEFMGGGR